MRILTDKPCKVTFMDNIGGGKLTLEYRLPTTEERIEYTNTQIMRKGRKVESVLGDIRQKFGAKLLTGITDGEWQKEDGSPLSSQEKNAGYDPAWKELVKKFAPDVIASLAIHAFENTLYKVDMSDDEEDPT